ncbi:MAG: EAL domain-containing protein [bacterium]
MAGFADVPDAGDTGLSQTGEPGRLFLWFPVGLALHKVRRYLRQVDRLFATTVSGALTVESPEGYPRDLLVDLVELLTEDEGADTRCVFKRGGDELEPGDIRRVRTIHELRALHQSSWLVEMLRGDRLTSVFQPIVHADETSRVLGHEALLRGIGFDGQPVSPGPMFDAARGCGMVPELDRAARRSAIRVAGATEERRKLFLNFTPEVLRDGGESVAQTIDAIAAADIPRDRVVFEVIDSGRTVDVRQLCTIVDSVRHAGFRVALDDIGCGEHSRRLIHEVRPDFIKLDMDQVRRASSQSNEDYDAERLLDLAQQLKVETIAEGVETGEELAWNRVSGATYVQGYFIGRPGALSE